MDSFSPLLIFIILAFLRFNEDSLSKKSMLSHYDDPMNDEVHILSSFIYFHSPNTALIIIFTYQGVTLDEGGRFTGEAERKLEEVNFGFHSRNRCISGGILPFFRGSTKNTTGALYGLADYILFVASSGKELKVVTSRKGWKTLLPQQRC
jgi:hypothetical protein